MIFKHSYELFSSKSYKFSTAVSIENSLGIRVLGKVRRKSMYRN